MSRLTPRAVARETRAVDYDFKRPIKLTRDHLRTLQMCYETFARRLTTLLASGLRQVCQVSLVAIEHQSYEEYVAALATPTVLSVLDLGGVPGTGLFEFSVPTALGCVDYLLGGPGGEQPARQLTDLETGLLRDLIEQMLSVLSFALLPIGGIKPHLRTVDFNPQFVQAAGATDSVIVGSFSMRVGNQECVATLCIPFGSMLPSLQADKADRPKTEVERAVEERSARRVRDALGGVPVEVSVVFQTLQLSPAEIIALAPGDVVRLRHRVTTPLAITSAGIDFAHALAGRQGSRLAGLVVSTDTTSSSKGVTR